MGIDPGADGGMSLINDEGSIIMFDRINELPSIVQFFTRARREGLNIHKGVTCVFEEYKGDGAANATRHSGMYVGIVSTLCYIHNIPLFKIAPQTWKAFHKLIIHQAKGLPKLPDAERYKQSKERSMGKFRELFPEVNVIFPRCKKEHEGVIESLLIAEYGRMMKL